MKARGLHMSNKDAFILANYNTLGPVEISKRLGMPKGSVITRHKILTGVREGNRYYKKPDFYKLTPRRSRNGRFLPGVPESSGARPVPSLPKIGLDR